VESNDRPAASIFSYATTAVISLTSAAGKTFSSIPFW